MIGTADPTDVVKGDDRMRSAENIPGIPGREVSGGGAPQRKMIRLCDVRALLGIWGWGAAFQRRPSKNIFGARSVSLPRAVGWDLAPEAAHGRMISSLLPKLLGWH